jgi:hypothetical protein
LSVRQRRDYYYYYPAGLADKWLKASGRCGHDVV